MHNIIAIEDKTLSKSYDKRFVIIDKDTKEILDDAQGFGYKSAKKAYAAYHYKNRDKSKNLNKQNKELIIRKWMNEHKNFVQSMDSISFEITKGAWGPDAKFDTAFVSRMLKEYKLQTDFTAKELLKAWKKR